MDFTDITHLKTGNQKQQLAYEVLSRHSVMKKLIRFTPVLAGTIPIGIDIDSSDLDILCYWQDKREFIASVKQAFQQERNFHIYENTVGDNESVIANFFIENFEIELFGQNIPITQQQGYRHMLIEYKILQQKGEDFRQQIIRLKKLGMKTEPAFAKLLGIEGDPYIELLKYK